jgi:hypothetical protein
MLRYSRFQVLERGVKGIGVLHGELAPAHDAEARPDLVAELGLDLIEVPRQLPIAAKSRRAMSVMTSSWSDR